jgi:hypothetical protein
MCRAVSPIDQLLGVTQGKAGAASVVSRIGDGRGVTELHARCERSRSNRPRPATVSVGLEFPIPPDAGIQISILISESPVGFSVAVTLQNAGSSLNAALGRRHAPGGDGLRWRYRGIRQRERTQAFTGCGCLGWSDYARKYKAGGKTANATFHLEPQYPLNRGTASCHPQT